MIKKLNIVAIQDSISYENIRRYPLFHSVPIKQMQLLDEHNYQTYATNKQVQLLDKVTQTLAKYIRANMARTYKMIVARIWQIFLNM